MTETLTQLNQSAIRAISSTHIVLYLFIISRPRHPEHNDFPHNLDICGRPQTCAKVCCCFSGGGIKAATLLKRHLAEDLKTMGRRVTLLTLMFWPALVGLYVSGVDCV